MHLDSQVYFPCGWAMAAEPQSASVLSKTNGRRYQRFTTAPTGLNVCSTGSRADGDQLNGVPAIRKADMREG